MLFGVLARCRSTAATLPDATHFEVLFTCVLGANVPTTGAVTVYFPKVKNPTAASTLVFRAWTKTAAGAYVNSGEYTNPVTLTGTGCTDPGSAPIVITPTPSGVSTAAEYSFTNVALGGATSTAGDFYYIELGTSFGVSGVTTGVSGSNLVGISGPYPVPA